MSRLNPLPSARIFGFVAWHKMVVEGVSGELHSLATLSICSIALNDPESLSSEAEIFWRNEGFNKPTSTNFSSAIGMPLGRSTAFVYFSEVFD